MNSVYDTAVAQIEKEFQEDVRQAEAEKQKKIDALNVLRSTLQTLFITDFEQETDSVPGEQKSPIAQDASVEDNGNQAYTPNTPTSERINKEIALFGENQRFSQQIIFDSLAKKYTDIKEHTKPGNVRSQITTRLKKMTDDGELRIVEVGRASNPNVYQKKSRNGLFNDNEKLNIAKIMETMK